MEETTAVIPVMRMSIPSILTQMTVTVTVMLMETTSTPSPSLVTTTTSSRGVIGVGKLLIDTDLIMIFTNFCDIILWKCNENFILMLTLFCMMIAVMLNSFHDHDSM